MRRNNFLIKVPLKKKGVRKYLKHKMRFIGSIYRSSKGQYMHNKFTRKFYTPHFIWIKKSNKFLQKYFFKKIITSLTIIESPLLFITNIDKFGKNYYLDEYDMNYIFFSKNQIPLNYNIIGALPTPLYFTKGVIFLPSLIFLKKINDNSQDSESFFKKFELVNLTNTHNLKNFEKNKNNIDMKFLSQIDMLYIIEIYKIHTYFLLNFIKNFN